MANRFQVMQAKLNARFQEKANVTITYHRGTASVIITDAWVGNTMFKILDIKNQRMEWGDRDYLIPITSLVIGGQKVVPLKDDWIEEVFPLPYGAQQFNLSAPENEPIWRFSDVQRTLYRVHTKRVTV